MNRRELVLGTLTGVVSGSLTSHALHCSDSDRSSEHETLASAPGDRWMEIDLYWFRLNDISGSVEEFWDRYLPLFSGIEGDCGVILNVGWTVEYIMNWSGNLAQRIVLPAANGQQPWVAEMSPLKGNWEQRKAEWKRRFAQPIHVPRREYGPWTYGDLKTLAAGLRSTANNHGTRNFKVGSLALAWTAAYGTEASVYGTATTFLSRHPEAFTAAMKEANFGSFFNPGNALHQDAARFGGLPDGIPEGMPVHRAFAAQWGSMSRTVGLNAIMLRDSFGMPVPYERNGPFGRVAPSRDIARRFHESVAALVRETKKSNPAALVMMYSNGASAIGDWRCNCCDLEAIASEGYLDVFVDQTWAGAWNEVGVRHDDFWNRPGLGYTYQLAYLLMHAAILAATKVRHYPLIETFDAWESWDVLHTVPERLRWEVWAYMHAGVKTPDGLKLPAGSYISWGNQGERLLSKEDVHFLVTNIGEATRNARGATEVFGPTLVYSRETMQWQMDHASPDNDIKEWIDETAGSVMKWPLSILSATRMEWLPKVHSDLFILQTPVHLSQEQTELIAHLVESGQPMAILGSPVGGIAPELERLGGLSGVKKVDEREKIHSAQLDGSAPADASNLPASFPTLTALSVNRNAAGIRVHYLVDGSPVLIVNTQKKIVLWDPPALDTNSEPGRPLIELWGGSAAPYALAAGALNGLLSTSQVLHAKQIDMNQTMSICAWRTVDGKVYLLAANLEEGLRDVSDASCHAALVLPKHWNAAQFSDVWGGEALKVNGNSIQIDLGHAQSRLYRYICGA